MNENVLIVRYSEIHLKGLNRPYFEKALADKIKDSLRDLGVTVVREQGRIFVEGIPKNDLDESVVKLQNVFGIHSISPAVKCEKSWEKILEASKILLESYLKKEKSFRTFKVFSRRADKLFPMVSEEICKELGHFLLEEFPELTVDVHEPQIKVGVEIRKNNAYIYCSEYKAVGGMPVGTNGKAMLLISGGIDSPVAGYMIAKRGVELNAIHFYSYPYTSPRARDKVVDLTKLVASFSGKIKLFLVPFTDIQLTIYEKCPKAETTIIMRRIMMEIAERVANRENCKALITGESIGQVASQTIESLAATNDAVQLPVFRPLIGFDKDEIVEYAKKIGTFETSILPYEDCCTVFVPKHPVTKPDVCTIRASEKAVDFSEMINNAIENIEEVEVS